MKAMSAGGSIYIFADPFGRLDSGVSSYVKNATAILGMDKFPLEVVSRKQYESLPAYRKRLSRSVSDAHAVYSHVTIEAPESDASTADIPAGIADIHIRLHCSRQLGAFVQGESICANSLAMEQREISRATYLSAPSQSAVIASSKLFNLRKDICCYPNPAPVSVEANAEKATNERKYVVFVGRFHHLKGAGWAVELAKSLPSVPFLMVGPEAGLTSHPTVPDNISFLDGNEWRGTDIFSQAKLVIIPSLYETASMVGIEALAMGVPIVAWRHLGIAEYASAPDVTLIEPYQIDEFSKAVQKGMQSIALHAPSNVGDNLNDLFLKGHHAALLGEHKQFMPVKLSEESAAIVSANVNNTMKDISMFTSKPHSAWQRKLRKLRRDPVRFFKDMSFVRNITPPGRASIPAGNDGARNVMSSELKPFVRITAGGPIKFQAPPSKPVGLITAFLHSECRNDDAQQLISGLSNFDDFTYVRKPHLQIGTFEGLEHVNSLKLLERIDLKNKKNISGVDHLLLLDPPPVLVEALRSAGTRQRTIVILSKEETAQPDPLHTDVLIVVGKNHPAAKSQGWRRKIITDKLTDLPMAIRRAIQEGSPKTPDMLLPLLGFDGNYREELLGCDVKFHQGIIVRTDDVGDSNGTMEDTCLKLARAMTGLAVTESVYLRYRSLCDQIDDIEARTQFLSYSLYDGMIFDVRT